MKLSLFFDFDAPASTPSEAVYQAVEDRVLLAEALGFHTAWVAEHHFGYWGRLASPLVFLALLAGRTRTIGLGTAVVAAPLYSPQRLLEDVQLVEAISHNRLHLGIGFGEGSDTRTFEAFGVPLDQRVERTRESALALKAALGDAPLAQRLLVAGGSATPAWIGENSFGLLIPRVGGSASHRVRLARYRESLEGKPGRVALLRFVYVAETVREARDETRGLVKRLARTELGTDWDGRTDTPQYETLLTQLNLAIGTPDQVRERLEDWKAEHEPDELLCQVDAPDLCLDASLRSLQLLGWECLAPTAPASERRYATNI